MKAPLTPEDKKSLRYECRPGILFGVGIFILGAFFNMVGIILKDGKETPNLYLFTFVSFVLLIVVSLFLTILFIRKYLQDLKQNEKDLIRYPIQKKESKVDYEVGSASLWYTQKMKPFDHYIFTINNSQHEVDRQTFERANVGDEVTMHIAPVSGHVLKIGLVK